MRVLAAVIIGGIAMFLWGAVAHMALGLGNPGLRVPWGRSAKRLAL